MADAGLGPVVAALWKELGLAPPVERIETEFDFELDEMPMTLALANNGETVVLRGRIGFLEGNAHEAGDQLQRVLRLGLGLTAMNGAVLDAAQAEDVLERDHVGQVPVFAVATAQVSKPASILPAIRAVIDWRAATGSILTQGAENPDASNEKAAGRSQAPDEEMIIFQP